MIIDGKNAVLGRMATQVAKTLLKGEEVDIINAEKVIITGSPRKIIDDHLAKRKRGNPFHGPFNPRKPDMIVRRTVRGMIPYKTHKGRAAFRKLKVHINIPKELEGKETQQIGIKKIKTNYITVGKLSKSLGWE